MPAANTGLPIVGGVLESWRNDFGNLEAYRTARSALAALLVHQGIRTTWLPAYLCTSLADGVRASGGQLRFYGVDKQLRPDFEYLAGNLRPGEAVVAIDYFGFPQPGFRDLRSAFEDVLWIEDRAQALDAGPEWGDVILYSPRKLLGVGDGGILVSNRPLPQPVPGPPDPSLWAPEEARACDPNGEDPERWYPLFRRREERLRVENVAASSRMIEALAGTALTPLSQARGTNWRTLARGLGDYALWPEIDVPAPLAFPILTEDAAAAQRAMAEERIWAPRHWADLPSPPDEFPEEADLSRRLLSLPCDHRYTEADMMRIVEAVRRRLRPYPR